MTPTNATLERLKQSRSQLTITFDEAAYADAERAALQQIGQNVEIKGFRAGKAPESALREKVDQDRLFEESVRLLLKDELPRLIEEHKLEPIMPPRVEAVSRLPVTLKLTIVERPQVTVKGLDQIKVERKEPKADPKDVQRVIDSVLSEQRTVKVVEREARDGDQVTVKFTAQDAEGKAVEGLTADNYAVTIGSSKLLPGFEPMLVGLKKGDAKEFKLTLPEGFAMEHLRGKEVTFSVEAQRVEEVKLPELTDEFAQKHLQNPTAAGFRAMVEESIVSQERQFEDMRREQKLMEEIRDRTEVDIAPELLDEEVNALIQDLQQRLEAQNTTIEQWMKSQDKSTEQVMEDLRKQAEQRIKLRFGMTKVIEERKVELTAEERTNAVEDALRDVPDEQMAQAREYFKPGNDGYAQVIWQALVRKALASF
jgi:trigger factor